MAPDGQRIVVQLNGSLWIRDMARATFDRLNTIGTLGNSFPAWTPDSKAVLISSDRNGKQEIFKQAIDQPLAESLMTGADQIFRVTPDSSEILYISSPQPGISETLSSIFAIPIGGGSPRLVLKDVGIWNLQCARLPSTICNGGTWIVQRW